MLSTQVEVDGLSRKSFNPLQLISKKIASNDNEYLDECAPSILVSFITIIPSGIQTTNIKNIRKKKSSFIKPAHHSRVSTGGLPANMAQLFTTSHFADRSEPLEVHGAHPLNTSEPLRVSLCISHISAIQYPVSFRTTPIPRSAFLLNIHPNQQVPFAANNNFLSLTRASPNCQAFIHNLHPPQLH